MKKASSLILAAVLAGTATLQAAIEKELGQALAYLRVTDAKEDRAAAVDLIERRPALVLDLRCLVADAGFAEAIQKALAAKPAPHAVRMILVNSATSPAVISALNSGFIDVVTLGPKSAAIKTDIEVGIAESDDLKAFASLTADTPVEKVITDHYDKRRYDEAKLVHDHANGVVTPDAELPADADDDSVPAEPADGKKPSETEKKQEPVLDQVLQRAVQLHRSLLALKKL